jgi:hypothetical protein
MACAAAERRAQTVTGIHLPFRRTACTPNAAHAEFSNWLDSQNFFWYVWQ